jgi:hypothetical protein
MASSQGFRRLPQDITKIWSLREMSLIAAPSSSAAAEVTYQSPLKEIALTIQFMSTDDIDSLPYVKDDDSFVPEWNFANEAWEKFTSGVTDLVTAYNKELLLRARERKLTSVSVIGRCRTEYDTVRKPEEIPPAEDFVEASKTSRQVQTVYEPSVRSTNTRKSRLTPIQAWMTGQPYKPQVR